MDHEPPIIRAVHPLRRRADPRGALPYRDASAPSSLCSLGARTRADVRYTVAGVCSVERERLRFCTVCLALASSLPGAWGQGLRVGPQTTTPNNWVTLEILFQAPP